MYEVLLFAGTAEGRKIAEYMEEQGIRALVFVATEYGESLISFGPSLQVEWGRLSEAGMEEKMEASPGALVIDATHPYAAEVTENIRTACRKTGRKYIRVLRKSQVSEECEAVFVESPSEAADYLSGQEGRILLTTGSKELKAFTAIPGYRERVYARVLSLPQVVAECSELGFQGKHLICMQGPFSKEMNCALIRQTGARFLVTKDTGAAGGFLEKEEAAKSCGCRLVIIGRPMQEEGISLEECLELLGSRPASGQSDALAAAVREPGTEHMAVIRNIAAAEPEAEIALVGIGMGGAAGATMTVEAREYCEGAELLIGAKRMVQAVARPGQEIFEEYRAEETAAIIRNHSGCRRIAVLLSGDVGFYSGAKKLLALLPESTRLIPGIGSLVYFCAKLKTAWEDVTITSNHGRHSNLVGLCNRNRKVFSLMGKGEDIRSLCRKFRDYGMNRLTVHVGENLSYPEERITTGNPGDFLDFTGDSLSVILVENPEPELLVTHGIPDEAFLRDKVPMTKEEVREISVSKLQLTKDSVVYDVGAGSGSVSVEMARQSLEGQVFAVEKNPVAVELLYANRRRFRADNLTVVEGLAPEALVELPAPTHAFIGGSSGNLKEILELLLSKNPNIRVVINAITLETLSESLEALKALGFAGEDIASVSVAKSRTAGRYHMMMGQNPVYVIAAVGTGGGGHEA